MVTLPLIASVEAYSLSTTLDGVVYNIDVRWNGRDEAWYFDLSTSEGDLIRAGMKIVLGALPGVRVVDPRFPPGLFGVLDTSGSGLEASFTDLGSRVVVTYQSPDELVAVLP